MEIVRYSLLRLVLLLGAAALLYLAGMRGALLWLAAIVFAFLVAFILFPSTGDAAAERVKRVMHRAGSEADAHEDDQVAEGVAPDGAGADAEGVAGEGMERS